MAGDHVVAAPVTPVYWVVSTLGQRFPVAAMCDADDELTTDPTKARTAIIRVPSVAKWPDDYLVTIDIVDPRALELNAGH